MRLVNVCIVMCIATLVLASELPPNWKHQWAVKLKEPGKRSVSDRHTHMRRVAHHHGLHHLGQVANLEEYHLFQHPNSSQHKQMPQDVHKALGEHPDVEWMEYQHPRQHSKRLAVTDPLFAHSWHLLNTGTNSNGGTAGVDINVMPAWDSNVFGRDVTISIVDDGLEWRHTDLGSTRYVSSASFDWNNNDGDPSPVLSDDTHGTSCGGLSFASQNNGVCSSGVAPQAKFSAQRLISGPTTDAMEANALSHSSNVNFIYSASWGPQDDGKRLEGPGSLLRLSLQTAIANGRNGKGTIYVWAGGNGGSSLDNVNYDGYANSIYTIAIGAADGHGRAPSYSEHGSPLTVSVPSSPPGINTIAVHNGCSSRFGGTSASAPIAAGAIALLLEVNPDLSWRDVPNILVHTAKKNDANDADWKQNGAGLWVNHKYGFGLLDAGAAVAMAATYQLLPPARAPLEVPRMHNPSVPIPDNDPRGVLSTVEVSDSFIVEHVEIKVRVAHPNRGDLKITLTSPAGTPSVLCDVHYDYSRDISWIFTSNRLWGENSAGIWTLQVEDGRYNNRGEFNSWGLILHGHSE